MFATYASHDILMGSPIDDVMLRCMVTFLLSEIGDDVEFDVLFSSDCRWLIKSRTVF